MEKLKRLSVRITDEEYLILEELANEHSTSVSSLVRNKLFSERSEHEFKEENKKDPLENLPFSKNQKEFLEGLATSLARKIKVPENISQNLDEPKYVLTEEQVKTLIEIGKSFTPNTDFADYKSIYWKQNVTGLKKLTKWAMHKYEGEN